MSILSRSRIDILTDTGANYAETTGPITGEFVQMGYVPADTGIRLDTGAVLTLTHDTGGLNAAATVVHLAPNGASWRRSFQQAIFDTGGGQVGTERFYPIHLASEKLTASIQGISTDTGKQGTVFFYFRE